MCRSGFSLLQEGAGHAVLSAYVEIVFDNSDNRLPVSRLTQQKLLPCSSVVRRHTCRFYTFVVPWLQRHTDSLHVDHARLTGMRCACGALLDSRRTNTSSTRSTSRELVYLTMRPQHSCWSHFWKAPFRGVSWNLKISLGGSDAVVEGTQEQSVLHFALTGNKSWGTLTTLPETPRNACTRLPAHAGRRR